MELATVSRFIAVGAHCDDVDLRLGGTFRRLVREGKQGCYVVACENVYAHGGFPRQSSRGVLATRRAEAQAAAGILGAGRVEFLEFKSHFFTREDDPYSHIYPTFSGLESLREELQGVIWDGLPPLANAVDHPACRERFGRLLDEVRPEVVFTHYPDDHHADHWALARFVDVVVRERRERGREIEICFWEPGSASPVVGFSPNLFVELSEGDVAVKQKALDAYVSQFPPERLRGYAETRAAAYGALVGVPYAEALHAGQCAGGDEWSRGTEFVKHLILRPPEPRVYRLA